MHSKEIHLSHVIGKMLHAHVQYLRHCFKYDAGFYRYSIPAGLF